jgi:anti-anti-sigma regulatory factor
MNAGTGIGLGEVHAPSGARSPGSNLPTLTVSAGPQVVVVSIRGVIDSDSVDLVRDALEAALATKAAGQRLEINLDQAEWRSAAGLQLLASCARLGADVGSGLRFRLGRRRTAD